MKRPILLFVLVLMHASVYASGMTAGRQDPATITKTVEIFLKNQTRAMPGEVTVHAGPVDSRLNVAPCAAMEAFTTVGSRMTGSITVGVRCTAPSPWIVYVPATVKVMTDVVVSLRPLAHGETVGASDVMVQKADLGQLPPGVITDPVQAVGKTVGIGIMAGQPVRQDMLRSPPAVMAGQTVKVVSRGNGFEVSSEGKALSQAAVGQLAQVRVTSGQVVSGVARAGGLVEITF